MLKVSKKTTCDVWSEVNLKWNVFLKGRSLNFSISMCCQMVVQGCWQNIVQVFFSWQIRRITFNISMHELILKSFKTKCQWFSIAFWLRIELVTWLVLAFKLIPVITPCFPFKDQTVIFQWINVGTSIPEITVTLWSYCKHSLLKSIEAKPSWTEWLGKVRCYITDLQCFF